MPSTFNPFAHGGWPNDYSSSSNAGTVPQPSIFGALPYPTQQSSSSSPRLLTFRITEYDPDLQILKSTVVDPNMNPCFHISTDTPTPGFTVIHDTAHQPQVIIEWARHPVVEICNVVPKTRAKDWLALSSDRSYRTMRALNKTFVWAKDGADLCLYSAGLGSPELYARMSREDEEVLLDLTMEAVRIGLLGVCVTAAVLLQSGRGID
ncbi:hypothetical protein FB45DRAFT_1059646 [Roridomyces roridus]|uniref:Uncharacterized protein n=1 Tax=Roridomyces roridus TaxID=1738132 RepID=A0AAD7BSH8_9AGAR|nr:hypothetical protein FB45DRAFT_1059646 [Roridomyces roridus]